MHDRSELDAERSLSNLGEFLTRRWTGQHPTLWDKQLIQAELLEALYCGFFGLEL
jgi:glycerol-3-phosphate dehydrogenase